MLHAILCGLKEKGFRVELVCSAFRGCKRREIVDGIHVNRFGSPLTFWIYALARYFALRSEAPCLVIESIGTGSPLWLSPVVVRGPKLLIIYHLGGKNWYVSKIRGYFRTRDFLMPFLAVLAYVAESLLPFVYRNVPVLTFSQSTRNELVGLGFHPCLINTVQEGIDLGRYKPTLAKDSKPSLVCVGRLVPGKGIELLLRCMVYIVRKVPEVTLYVMGRGEQKDILRLLSRSLQVGENVRFLGYVSEDDKIERLGRSHVAVVPSIKEGFATPAIEANACGTVAVGWDVKGVSEAICSDVVGYVVPFGDLKELSDKIVFLLSNSEVRKRMEEKAKLWAKKYDKAAMVRASVSLMLRLLSPAAKSE